MTACSKAMKEGQERWNQQSHGIRAFCEIKIGRRNTFSRTITCAGSIPQRTGMVGAFKCCSQNSSQLHLWSPCRVEKKVAPILGGFEKTNYKSEREWAVADDGTKVPISIGESGYLYFFSC